jgi:hypothetical protein
LLAWTAVLVYLTFPPHRTMLLAFILFLALAAARAPKHAEVYGIYTDFGPGNQRTIVQSGRVNLTSGAVTQQATLFQYLGSSGTFDGISAYDQEDGILYYVNDFADAYVWGVGTRYPYALTAPIFLEDNGVENVAWDWKDKQLLITDFVKQTGAYRLVIFPKDPIKSTRTYVFPASVTAGPGAYDPEKGLFFNLNSLSSSSSVLTAFDVSSGVAVQNLTVQCGNINKVWVEESHPDFTSRLWGVRANFTNNNLSYDLINVNLASGACPAIRIPSQGIVTAFAFDERNGVLFYNDATNGGNFLRTTSVRTGKSSQLLLLSEFTLSDLAVRFVDN